ncbi:MAG: hypothetical protein LBB39_03325 [Mycoplasmataceae bacterium]|jgi:uncharacterized membrane protein YhaH (DUF805 family)|nr:hypothetical protein [Mycoplasmataceae bacterium]
MTKNKKIAVKFSLANLIIQSVLIGTLMLVLVILFIVGGEKTPQTTTNLIILISIVVPLVVLVPILFYCLIKHDSKKPNKNIALAICAIIFGGTFNIIAGIILLVDNECTQEDSKPQKTVVSEEKPKKARKSVSVDKK